MQGSDGGWPLSAASKRLHLCSRTCISSAQEAKLDTCKQQPRAWLSDSRYPVPPQSAANSGEKLQLTTGMSTVCNADLFARLKA